MPGYVQKVLHRFDHPTPSRPQHAPHKWERPNYGAPVQYNSVEPDLPLLPPKQITRIQQIIGALLYYARAVDNTMLVALNCVASEQSAAARATASATNLLLDYAATHPETVIRYHASGMRLHINSDASYLSVRNSRSRAGGLFFLSDNNGNCGTAPTSKPTPNGVLHAECKTLRNVMASAAEAELGALFHNGQVAEPIRTCLAEMGYPQPQTP